MGKSGNPAKRAAESNAEPVEYAPTPVDADGVEDFDAYWDTANRKAKRVRIMGEVVALPKAIPLQFTLEADRVGDSQDVDDIKRVVGILFGEDAVERWAKAGMDEDQFNVLLAWAPQRIRGGSMSLAEVADELRKAKGLPSPH